MKEYDEFLDAAQNAIAIYFNSDKDLMNQYGMISKSNVFMVWFCKTLQNWKGLFGTNKPNDGLYYEFTWNGDKDEGYLDVYKKQRNIVVIK